jgi:hypothetical protein
MAREIFAGKELAVTAIGQLEGFDLNQVQLAC